MYPDALAYGSIQKECNDYSELKSTPLLQFILDEKMNGQSYLLLHIPLLSISQTF